MKHLFLTSNESNCTTNSISLHPPPPASQADINLFQLFCNSSVKRWRTAVCTVFRSVYQPDRWCSATEGNTSTSSQLGWNKNFCALTNQTRRFGRRFRQAMEKREHAACSSKQHPCLWAGHQFNHTSITFLVSSFLLSLMLNAPRLKLKTSQSPR